MKTKVFLILSFAVILTGMILSVLIMTGDIYFPMVIGSGAALLDVAPVVYIVVFGGLLSLIAAIILLGYAFNHFWKGVE